MKMNYLELLKSKDVKIVYLKGTPDTECDNGSTPNHNAPVSQVNEPRCLKGTGYVKEYLEKERLESDKSHAEESKLPSSSSGGLLDVEGASEGMMSNISDVSQGQLTRLYMEYYKDKVKVGNKLIINEYREKILSMIESNEVIIVSGPTGCGKTTQIPQFILDSHVQQNWHCNIVVTQPRRIAAMSIPKRVCEERDWPLGSICGYKVGLKGCISEDTRLTYCTNGIFLQTLVRQKHMNNFTHVILDEVHERDQALDFILLAVKKFLRTNSRNVKVILMSATADVSKIAVYFEKKIAGQFQAAPVISVGRFTNYQVQIHYLDELFFLGQIPDLDLDEPMLSNEAVDICIKLIKQFDQLESGTVHKKSVLVFLPGLFEIEDLYYKLRDPKIYKQGSQYEYKWLPVPLHSSITTEEQAFAFRAPPTGFRKIILATNIAESSITVPDMMYVIDFCLTKVLMTSIGSNFTSLRLNWASKANCIQRAGRVGRVMEGRVYRLVPRRLYENLPDHGTPDMLRCPLEKVVLQAKLLDIGGPKAVLAHAIDPPDLTNLEQTILILKEAGGLLLTVNGVPCADDGDLTYMGRLMAIMPVDIHITRLILLGYVFSCLKECIIMGAGLAMKSVFSSPFRARLKAYTSKMYWADGSFSDCIAFLNVYRVWRDNHMNGLYTRSSTNAEAGWAKRHLIQLRTLKEVQYLIEDIQERLKMHNIEETVGLGRVRWTDVEKSLVLKFVIGGAFYPNYFGRSERGGQVCEEQALRTLGGRNLFNTVYLMNYPFDQPRELYSHLIMDKLSHCGSDIKISYDGSSKVYVQFRKQGFREEGPEMTLNASVPRRIPTAVYRAVRMRQAFKHIEINVLPADEARKLADELGLRARSELLKRSPSTVASKEKLFPSTLPSVYVTLMKFKMINFATPGRFWGTYGDVDNQETEAKILELLNDPKAGLLGYAKPPPVGEMCVAPYYGTGKDILYRARVDGYSKPSMKTVQVFYIDYGKSALIPTQKLRRYGQELLEKTGKISRLCFECTLAKVRPSLLKTSDDTWCDEAFELFQEIVEKYPLMVSIFSVVEDVVSVVLYKEETKDGKVEYTNVNDLLVEKGYATATEENYLSTANHKLRMERLLDLEQTDEYDNIPKEEEVEQEGLVNPEEVENCRVPIKLQGPYSPLEMKVYSCIQSALSKEVRIAPSSVNTVLLDADPEDPHERLLVAAHVSQGQSGGHVTLGETTLMPNIHGFSSLIPYVFAPTIEQRVDNCRSRYTGILCGLGVDGQGNSMFPEHDMEITFDCEFTFDDFVLVNKLRFYMSLLLISDGEELPHSTPDVISFQKHVSEAFLELVKKQRPSKELEFPLREFRWNLVKPDVHPSSIIKGPYNLLSIFPSHVGVSINPKKNEQKKFLDRVDKLHAIAETEMDCIVNLMCELCSVHMTTGKQVRLHLLAPDHKDKEEKLRKSAAR